MNIHEQTFYRNLISLYAHHNTIPPPFNQWFGHNLKFHVFNFNNFLKVLTMTFCSISSGVLCGVYRFLREKLLRGLCPIGDRFSRPPSLSLIFLRGWEDGSWGTGPITSLAGSVPLKPPPLEGWMSISWVGDQRRGNYNSRTHWLHTGPVWLIRDNIIILLRQ